LTTLPFTTKLAAMRLTACAIVLALAAGAACAQGVYRSVMPDGRVIYGDKPAPGAKESRKVDVSSPNIATPGPSGGLNSPTPQQQALDTADASIKSAQQELDNAKAALEAGREPQPGERIGIAGGGSRLNEAYEQRIKGLEDAVAAAQKRLDEALAARNAAR